MFIGRMPQGELAGYTGRVQAPFGSLQRVLTQAAGFALLVVSPGRRVALPDTPVATARAALAAARAEIEAGPVPPAARRHHHHVMAAAAAMSDALDLLMACLRCRDDDPARADLVRMLRVATDHLRAATRLLPGFAMVDLSQACCAAHAAPAAARICQTVEGQR